MYACLYIGKLLVIRKKHKSSCWYHRFFFFFLIFHVYCGAYFQCQAHFKSKNRSNPELLIIHPSIFSHASPALSSNPPLVCTSGRVARPPFTFTPPYKKKKIRVANEPNVLVLEPAENVQSLHTGILGINPGNFLLWFLISFFL